MIAVRTGHAREFDSVAEEQRPPGEASLVALDVEQYLGGFHDGCRRIPETEVSQLLEIRFQTLCVNNSVAAHSIVIAAQPDRDVLRIGDFVAQKLVTGHL